MQHILMSRAHHATFRDAAPTRRGAFGDDLAPGDGAEGGGAAHAGVESTPARMQKSLLFGDDWQPDWADEPSLVPQQQQAAAAASMREHESAAADLSFGDDWVADREPEPEQGAEEAEAGEQAAAGQGYVGVNTKAETQRVWR